MFNRFHDLLTNHNVINYPETMGLFRKAQGLVRDKITMLILKHYQKNPLYYEDQLRRKLLERAQMLQSRWKLVFPGSCFAEQVDSWNHIGRFRGTRMLAAIYNSGRHLYFTNVWPNQEKTSENLRILKYKEFAWPREIGDVIVQHLGHVYGFDGGRAWILVTSHAHKKTREITCEPQHFYYLVDFGIDEALFAQPLFLSKRVMSHG